MKKDLAQTEPELDLKSVGKPRIESYNAPPVAGRHRFSERSERSERTTIMPLADILRRSAKTAPAGAAAAQSPFAESTKLSLNPFLDPKTGMIRLPGQAPLAPPPAQSAPESAEAAAPAAPSPPAATAAPRPTAEPAPSAPVAATSRLQGAVAARANDPQAAGPEPATAREVPAAPSVRPARPTQQVLVFFACKGGAGTTALTSSVAHTYARQGYRSCLLDMDLQLGDALAVLGLQPRQSTARTVEMVGRGESAAAATLPQHRTGVAVLSQVGSLEDLDKVTSEGLAAVVESLRVGFDTVVVDGVRDFSDNVLAVLDVADRIALVVLQEVLAIRRGRWAFDILRKIGFDPRDVTVVVNRYNPQHEITLATLGQMFAPAAVVSMARDELLVGQALDRGAPIYDLNPRHPLNRQIADLAASLIGVARPKDAALPPALASKKEDDRGLADKLMFWRRP